jgi:hypothetical protein
MQCEQFESRLHDLLDRRSRPERDDALRAHAFHCPACRQVLDTQELLWDGLEFFEAPEMSSNFASRVLSQYQPPQPANDRVRKVFVAVCAVAAALLVIVIPILRGSNQGSDDGASALELVVIEPSSPIDMPLPDAIDRVDDVQPRPIADENVASTSPPIGQHDGVTSEGVALSPEYPDLFAIWTEQLNLIPPEQMESVDQISGGLRPIATSFSAAINLLRRTLPVGKEQPPQKPQAGILNAAAGQTV